MQHDDGMVGRLLSRRELVALFGAAGVAAFASPLRARQAGAPVPGCVVRPQQTEGPYFVDEHLNRSDIRPDPATGAARPGARLGLTFTVLRVAADGACTPLPGAQVDLWHCDALGVYSDVRDRSFDTTGQTFLRGYQVTDASGTARFVTIYPGWYPGRAVHIHVKVRAQAGARRADEFTSQLYFDEGLTDRVHAGEPYSTHAGARLRNDSDRLYGNGGSQLVLPVGATDGGYSGTFVLGMRPGDSAPAGPGRARGGRAE